MSVGVTLSDIIIYFPPPGSPFFPPLVPPGEANPIASPHGVMGEFLRLHPTCGVSGARTAMMGMILAGGEGRLDRDMIERFADGIAERYVREEFLQDAVSGEGGKLLHFF